MQTDDDAGRIIELGAPPGRVHVAGSLKFDAAAVVPPPELEHMRRALDAAHLRAIVAGSTHDGEEAMVLDAYDRVVRGHRETILLLAPRHPERVAGVADLVAARGIPLLRYSELVRDPTRGLPAAPLVLLLDVVGPLAHCYALGEVAFVGGSLVPVGGHNVLEPARAARPIVVGPHTDSIRDLVERLRRVDAAIQVDSAEALAWTVDHLLANPELAQRMGRQGAALAQAGQGALDRHMRIIAARLERTRFVRDGE
jgi:3-deoxy-D-manno-octulosonic-acid transferase